MNAHLQPSGSAYFLDTVKPDVETHALAVIVDNEPGVLARVIGLFSMASGGMRAFSGVTIGIVGSIIGIHWSLALAAMGLFTMVSVLMAFMLRPAAR